MNSTNQEKKEIDVLLNKGFKIEIKARAQRYKDGLAGFFLPPEEVEEREILEFKEPTLAVLDLVTAEYLKLEISEPAKGASETEIISRAHETIKKNAKRMARIVAIFALGEKAFKKHGGAYEPNESAIVELSEKIFHALTPDKLEKVISLCTALSNLPGFLTSIRLTGASRTTKTTAHLVE